MHAAQAGVAAALEHLKRASPRVAFRDLAPERVAVALDGRPVLADFGDAKPIESLSHTLCGTPEFVAPEMARGCAECKSSIRLQCARMRQFRRNLFGLASRTQ